MIDTSKYDGHTPGPWVAKHDRAESEMGGIVIYDRGWVVCVGEKDSDAPQLQNSTFGREELNEADARLIADAPLLLEEVKRLREWKAEVERICRTMSGPNRDTALFIMTNEVEEE